MTQPAYAFPDFWTEADLDALPDDGHRYEILDGSLHMAPPPSGQHQSLSGNLYLALRLAAPAGHRVLYEFGLKIPAGNLVPDLVVLRPGADVEPVWHDPGDVLLVVEVVSPSTKVMDRRVKTEKYAEAGIPSYWRIDRDGTVVVEELRDGRYETVATVRPGTTWTATAPFQVVVDPQALTGDR